MPAIVFVADFLVALAGQVQFGIVLCLSLSQLLTEKHVDLGFLFGEFLGSTLLPRPQRHVRGLQVLGAAAPQFPELLLGAHRGLLQQRLVALPAVLALRVIGRADVPLAEGPQCSAALRVFAERVPVRQDKSARRGAPALHDEDADRDDGERRSEQPVARDGQILEDQPRKHAGR